MKTYEINLASSPSLSLQNFWGDHCKVLAFIGSTVLLLHSKNSFKKLVKAIASSSHEYLCETLYTSLLLEYLY